MKEISLIERFGKFVDGSEYYKFEITYADGEKQILVFKDGIKITEYDDSSFIKLYLNIFELNSYSGVEKEDVLIYYRKLCSKYKAYQKDNRLIISFENGLSFIFIICDGEYQADTLYLNYKVDAEEVKIDVSKISLDPFCWNPIIFKHNFTKEDLIEISRNGYIIDSGLLITNSSVKERFSDINDLYRNDGILGIRNIDYYPYCHFGIISFMGTQLK